MSTKVKVALNWLKKLLESENIEYQIVGGLAQHTKIQSSADGSWHQLEIDFSKSVTKTYQGIELQVIPIHKLVEYKRLLAREVDLIDVQQLTSSSAP
ncbi:hypothetical protein [Vibrio sp. VA3]|uniref:hypothetical protein n=1 Tax=Vibrio sp. VA3 TaxID=2992765 RepID=UPI00237BB5AA|nr:hypothetical protein [Vibrio sp. VA3]MDE0545013.1 hypothetical protein [Vibrio sp. VA3]